MKLDARVLLSALALAVTAAFVLLACYPSLMAPVLRPLTRTGQEVIYDRNTLIDLGLWHLGVVAAAELVAVAIALGFGILVTRSRGADLMTLARMTSNLGQTFPPIAVLALCVPILGFGFEPTFVALAAYALLPIFENTVAGLHGVSATTLEAARGMGMSGRAILGRVELPLAAPIILAGIRVSTIISIGTATIGSTVGAKGLGEVIIAGLQTGNSAFILQGAILVALMAIAADLGLRALEAVMQGRRAALDP